MDENVLDIIRSYMPEAQIENSPHNSGSYKIRVPVTVNQMPKYEELRKALKESGAKPICNICHQRNTKFRYFDNNCSKALQARYKCLDCNNCFTLGGKQYSKDHNAIEKDQVNTADQARRSRHFSEVDNSELEIAETKRMREWGMASRSQSMNLGSGIEFHPDHLVLPLQQSGAYYHYRTLDFFQKQHEEQLAEFKQEPSHGTQYLHPPPPTPTENNSMQVLPYGAITGHGFPLSLQWQNPASSTSHNNIGFTPQLLTENSKAATAFDLYHGGPNSNDPNDSQDQLIEALTLPAYMQQSRMDSIASSLNKEVTNEFNINEDTNAGDDLKALLDSPGKDSSTDIFALIGTKKEE